LKVPIGVRAAAAMTMSAMVVLLASGFSRRTSPLMRAAQSIR
jgi:hypothetical protein